ncbi:MAG: DUF2332 family protein [Acidobacteria bacterium]|nr:DUF2332 family protein [Acidobacteriota bacterium]
MGWQFSVEPPPKHAQHRPCDTSEHVDQPPASCWAHCGLPTGCTYPGADDRRPANQFSSAAGHRLEQVISGLSVTRPVHRIGIEMVTRDQAPEIRHTIYSAGKTRERALGFTHHHGEWLEWCSP